jgi:hypothetical protein
MLAVEIDQGMEAELQRKAGELIPMANIVVDSPQAFEVAGEIVLEIDSAIKQREEFMAPLKQAAHKAWKGLCDRESEMLAPFRDARKGLKDRMSAYATEQDRIRRAEEARRQEEARAREAEERERLEEAASEAAGSGEQEVAEILQNQAANVIVTPQVVEPVIEKNTKTSSGSIISAADVQVVITDLKAFLKAMLADEKFPIPEDEIKKAVAGKLKKWAKLHNVESFPGLAINRVINPTFRKRV